MRVRVRSGVGGAARPRRCDRWRDRAGEGGRTDGARLRVHRGGPPAKLIGIVTMALAGAACARLHRRSGSSRPGWPGGRRSWVRCSREARRSPSPGSWLVLVLVAHAPGDAVQAPTARSAIWPHRDRGRARRGQNDRPAAPSQAALSAGIVVRNVFNDACSARATSVTSIAGRAVSARLSR